jgi:Flp pilus assembly CpaF family ATPase
MFDFLKACIEARLNLFVSGGTGLRQDDDLNVLSSFIPNDERIVTIEDAAELQLARTTSSRSSRARRTSRARARSRSATCSGTRCTCGPTG